MGSFTLLAAVLGTVLVFASGTPLTFEELQDVRSQCPATQGNYPVYIPHPRDCAVFFECSHGRPMLIQCPPGLHYNQYIKVCDFPQRAGCKANEKMGATAKNVYPITPNQPSFGIRDIRCPATNREVPLFLTHETNCELYYVCDYGKAFLLACPQGTLFNARKNICDHPQEVECAKSASDSVAKPIQQGPAVAKMLQGPPAEAIKSPEVPKEGSPKKSPGPSAEVARAPQMKLDSRCPKQNSIVPTFISHETDCGKYYICDWGYAILMQCPDTLGFDPTKNLCSVAKYC